MSCIDYLGVAISSHKQSQPSGYVCMSTVDDLSYTPSKEEMTRDAAQVVVTGRRSWKTLKGKGEAVWPPHLEAALLEALEKYQPDAASRPANAPSRYPMRNHFIADYIFETTGKRRTPKQVGSRLQQLRDTCKAKRIRQLISRRRRRHSVSDIEPLTSSPAAHGNSPGTFSPPVDSIHSTDQYPTYQCTVVWVAILLETLSWSTSTPIIHIEHNNKLSPLCIRLSCLPLTSYEATPTPPSTIHSLSSILSGMDPTVAFAVSVPLYPHSSFSVFLDETGPPVHTEVVTMQCHPCAVQNSGWLYTATLVPWFWKTLCDNPTRYTIVQNMSPSCRKSSDASFVNHSQDSAYPNDGPVISIVYHFNHSHPSSPEPVEALMNSAYTPSFQFEEQSDSQSISPQPYPPQVNSRSTQEDMFIATQSQSSTHGRRNDDVWLPGSRTVYGREEWTLPNDTLLSFR